MEQTQKQDQDQGYQENVILEHNKTFGVILFHILDNLKHNYQEITITDAKNIIKRMINDMKQSDDFHVILAKTLVGEHVEEFKFLSQAQKVNYMKRVEDIEQYVSIILLQKIVKSQKQEFEKLIEEHGLFGLIN